MFVHFILLAIKTSVIVASIQTFILQKLNGTAAGMTNTQITHTVNNSITETLYSIMDILLWNEECGIFGSQRGKRERQLNYVNVGVRVLCSVWFKAIFFIPSHHCLQQSHHNHTHTLHSTQFILSYRFSLGLFFELYVQKHPICPK